MTGTDIPAPVAVRERALAPDLARGAMLLLIALANVHVWLSSHPVGYRGYPVPESVGVLDRVVAGVQLALVDGRAYPLFGVLFGYGTVQLVRGLERRGATPDAGRRLLRRRGWWLVAIGAAHGVLLFPGDIAAAYGLIAVLLAGVVAGGRARPLRVLALVGTGVTVVLGLGMVLRPPEGTTALLASVGSDSALVALAFRTVEWVGIGLVFQVVTVVGAVAIGALVAQRRVLEDPARHRRLLVRVAVGGLGLAVVGAVPLVLVATGAVPDPSAALVLASGSSHSLSGYAGGLGYAALFALVALRAGAAGRRTGPGPVVGALSACGQRSLTCYLGQSVVFAVLLPRWSLGLGATLGVAQASALAVAVWASLVVLAAALARAGRRGPAEVLLRRLTYRA